MRAEESTSLCDIKFKIVFLGDMGVGKTSVIERFVKDEFETANNPTIGIDFLCRNMTYENKTYRLQLWDTAGQEKYKSLVPAYLRDANCAVFVVDITRPETLSNLKGWIQLFRDNQTETAIAIMLGNKCDLEEQRKISEQELLEYSRKEGLNYESVSAKSGHGIVNCFNKMLGCLSSKKKQDLPIDEHFEITERFFQKFEKLKAESGDRRMSCCYI